ncbi:vesicle-associated membrane protein 4-like [Ornithodoros turicata]|uniref:Putative vesicle-associated membrane protein 4 n=1 Tax=Ornithodoros turicata TaxID=34597 RepID=A0A2R5LN88_9ACAR
MPPKFRRYLSEEDVSESHDAEREKLLGEEDDDDFFLKGPSASNKTLNVQDKKLRRVQFQVDEVSDIMKGNIEKIMERGERLEDLGDKSDALATHADQFRSTAKKMQSRMWWRNMKVKIILAVIILVVMLIIFVPIIVRNS